MAAAAAVAAFASGCGGGHKTSGADKAGGDATPKVLGVGIPWGPDHPDNGDLTAFAKQVKQRSGGRLKIRIVNDAGGSGDDREAQTARLVSKGQLELGFVDARAWDELGVHSLQALEAPFLINDNATLVAVVKSRLGEQMLAGLQSVGVTGLALIPYVLNHPAGLTRPLASLADFAGARLAVIPEQATDTLVRALGATPVHVTPAPPSRPVTRRPIDGQLTSIFSAHLGTIVTANVNLPPDANTLVVNSAVLKSLTPDQRRALYDAADDLRAEFLGAGGVSEAKIVESWCKARGDTNPPAHAVAIASPAELSALARATRPIYAELERDAGTSALIARIRDIRSSLPPPPPLKVPATGCRPAAGRAALGRSRPTSLLNGTYRWIITKADARSKAADRSPAALAQWPACFEVTLRDGKWLGESCSGGTGRDVGTYSVTGRRISFQSPDRRGTFEFSIGRDRSLRLRAVGPMEPGDRFVLTTEPWRRIGPPVKAIR